MAKTSEEPVAAGEKPDQNRKRELSLFEKNSQIRFRSSTLLNLSFTHRSYSNETTDRSINNERLEFLGDSVLGLVVAEYLYGILPGQPEGELARIKSFVVSEDTLAVIARELRIDNFILIGKGEEFSGGRGKKAILADALEAVIGAYFLDSGFEAAKKFILRLLVPQIENVLEDKHEKDYKTLLQEYVQKTWKAYPKYTLVKKTGPDHNKTFWITVTVQDISFGPGKGKSKKDAERQAAALAYQHFLPEESVSK